MDFISARKLALFLALGIIVFAALLFYGDYRDVARHMASLDVQTILLMPLLVVAGYMLKFLRWQYLLRRMNFNVPFGKSFLILFSGFSMAITPAKSGEVLKSYLLKRSENIRVRDSIGVVFFERLTDIIALAAISLLGFSVLLNQIYLLALIALAAAFVLVSIINDRLFGFFASLFSRMPVVGRFAGYATDARNSAKPLSTFRSLATSTALGAAAWSAECLAFWILLNDLGFSAGFSVAAAVFAFSSVFGSLFITPGGVGAAEGSFAVLLLALGASASVASAATIIIRLATLWFGAIVGFTALFIFLRRFNLNAGSVANEHVQ